MVLKTSFFTILYKRWGYLVNSIKDIEHITITPIM